MVLKHRQCKNCEYFYIKGAIRAERLQRKRHTLSQHVIVRAIIGITIQMLNITIENFKRETICRFPKQSKLHCNNYGCTTEFDNISLEQSQVGSDQPQNLIQRNLIEGFNMLFAKLICLSRRTTLYNHVIILKHIIHKPENIQFEDTL